MIKKKGIILSLIISLVSICIMPFSVFAQQNVTITSSNIVGIYVHEQTNEGSTLAMVLDGNYIGTVTMKVTVQYFNGNNTTTANPIYTFKFNGNVGYGSTNTGRITTIQSYTIMNQSLALADTVETVYNIDYANFIGYQYWSLYNMSYSTGVAPITSLVTDSFRSITAYSQTSADPFIRMTEEDLYIAYFTNKNENNQSISIIYKPATSCTVTVTKVENDMFTLYTSGDYVFNLFRCHVNKPSESYVLNTSADRYIIRWLNKEGQNVIVIPVWYGMKSGMNEDMMRFLGLIEVDDSAEQLDEQTSDFSQESSELYSYENSFNESMNDSLDDIDVNFNIGSQFGSKFQASASWVKTQFDYITSGTPYGTVLSFSLLLGLALLLLGKFL